MMNLWQSETAMANLTTTEEKQETGPQNLALGLFDPALNTDAEETKVPYTAQRVVGRFPPFSTLPSALPVP